MCVSAQSCLTLCSPMDCSPSGSSVHGILQARILEWVAMLSSRGPSQPRSWTWVLHCRQILYHLSHQGSPQNHLLAKNSFSFLHFHNFHLTLNFLSMWNNAEFCSPQLWAQEGGLGSETQGSPTEMHWRASIHSWNEGTLPCPGPGAREPAGQRTGSLASWSLCPCRMCYGNAFPKLSCSC